MYIPVADATAGGTPSPIRTGLKTIAPPRPTAEVNPPIMEAANSLRSDFP